MPKSSDLYSYKTGSTRDEEMSFFSLRGRLPLIIFWERVLIVITSYLAINLFIELILSSHRNNFLIQLFDYEIDTLKILHGFNLIICVISLAIQSVKRAHDCNMRGWMALVNPLIYIQKGTRGNNDYGIDPYPQIKIEYFDEFEASKRFKESQVKKSPGLSLLTYIISSSLLTFVTLSYYQKNESTDIATIVTSFLSDLFTQTEKIEQFPIIVDTCMIGDMTWMASNLRVDTFANGEHIPQAQTKVEWLKAVNDKKPAWCYYDNDSRNDSLFGKLYNWYAVHDSRGLAPKGWRVASNQDWDKAISLLGGDIIAGKIMKSSHGWKYDDNAINLSNFKAMPGGYIKATNAQFMSLGTYGYWWTSDTKSMSKAINKGMEFDKNIVNSGSYLKGGGFSVRCVLNGGVHE